MDNYRTPESAMIYGKPEVGVGMCIFASIIYLLINILGTSELVSLILNSMRDLIGDYSPSNNLRMAIDIILSVIIMTFGVLLVKKMVKDRLVLIVCLCSVPFGIPYSYVYLIRPSEFPMIYNVGCVLSAIVYPIILSVAMRRM